MIKKNPLASWTALIFLLWVSTSFSETQEKAQTLLKPEACVTDQDCKKSCSHCLPGKQSCFPEKGCVDCIPYDNKASCQDGYFCKWVGDDYGNICAKSSLLKTGPPSLKAPPIRPHSSFEAELVLSEKGKQKAIGKAWVGQRSVRTETTEGLKEETYVNHLGANRADLFDPAFQQCIPGAQNLNIFVMFHNPEEYKETCLTGDVIEGHPTQKCLIEGKFPFIDPVKGTIWKATDLGGTVIKSIQEHEGQGLEFKNIVLKEPDEALLTCEKSFSVSHKVGHCVTKELMDKSNPAVLRPQKLVFHPVYGWIAEGEILIKKSGTHDSTKSCRLLAGLPAVILKTEGEHLSTQLIRLNKEVTELSEEISQIKESGQYSSVEPNIFYSHSPWWFDLSQSSQIPTGPFSCDPERVLEQYLSEGNKGPLHGEKTIQVKFRPGTQPEEACRVIERVGGVIAGKESYLHYAVDCTSSTDQHDLELRRQELKRDFLVESAY